MKVKHSEIFESRISDVWRVMTDLNDYAWRSDISRIEVFEQGNFDGRRGNAVYCHGFSACYPICLFDGK